MTRNNLKPHDIFTLNLDVDDVEFLLDKYGAIEQIIDGIKARYRTSLSTEKFRRIRDIIDILDITEFDEQVITKKSSKASLRSFLPLMSKGKLSRLEMIYYLKLNYATDQNVIEAFNQYQSDDFAEVILRWRPYLFEKALNKYCKKFKITKSAIQASKKRSVQLEKFRHILGQ